MKLRLIGSKLLQIVFLCSRSRWCMVLLVLAIAGMGSVTRAASPGNVGSAAGDDKPNIPQLERSGSEMRQGRFTEAQSTLTQYLRNAALTPRERAEALTMLAEAFEADGSFHDALANLDLLAAVLDGHSEAGWRVDTVLSGTVVLDAAYARKKREAVATSIKQETALMTAIDSERSVPTRHEMEGDLALLRRHDEKALANYEAAYEGSQADLDLTEDRRDKIAAKYLHALRTAPIKFRMDKLRTLARNLLSDQSASTSQQQIGLQAAELLLNAKLERPDSAHFTEYANRVLGMISSPVSPWNNVDQGAFIVSMMQDNRKRVWVGTEDAGVWYHDPNTMSWRQFTTKDGLGDDNGYALACDRLGRIWVGHLNHGVSVYDGSNWKNYGLENGPLGSRVFAITTNPSNGDVWISTDAGLSRYSIDHDKWSYYTKADGLPSNQATCLACNKRGVLFVGTACSGIAIGTPRDEYHSWRTVKGPYVLPPVPGGSGIPSNLINALLVSHDGTVWAGTTCGLARTMDSGVTWTYSRGKDWKAKLDGLRLTRKASANTSAEGGLLLEDYVTCLTESDSGLIYIGYRQQNFEVLEPATGRRIYPQKDDVVPGLYLSALLPSERGYVLLGRYGDGLEQEIPFAVGGHVPKGVYGSIVIKNRVAPSLPSVAHSPTIAELGLLSARSKTSSPRLQPGDGYYLGEDWVTEGDWVGRYGRQYSVLCAAHAPLDHIIRSVPSFAVEGYIGPHARNDDGLRHWIHWLQTDNPRCLYDPVPGYRRQSEWDDHGEDYGAEFEGPDIWTSVTVPAGIHRLSLYFMNKDGHGGSNRYRDYLVELRPFAPTPELAESLPATARARVRDFWGGVYERFVIAGPGKFWIKISKNNSFNTIVSSVFIDQLLGPKQPGDNGKIGSLGDIVYNAPDPDMHASGYRSRAIGEVTAGVEAKPVVLTPAAQKAESRLRAARNLWRSLDNLLGPNDAAEAQWTYRLFAYRAALTSAAPETLLGSWRWKLCIWEKSDRDLFNLTMASAHQSVLDRNPQMQGLDF